MNILPKKNWHVRSKTNIARVQADEAKAAEEERKEQERIKIAEQEARTNLLRSKARERLGDSGLSVVRNIFGGEDGKNETATNKDHELEKREEVEKKEKAIGLLTYLGQSALDPQCAKPWWSEAPSRSDRKKKLDRESKELFDEWDAKKKKRLDPMADLSRISDFFEERNLKQDADKNSRISQRQAREVDDKVPRLPNDIQRPQSSSRGDDRSSNEPKRRKKKKKEKKAKPKKHKKDKHRHDSPVPQEQSAKVNLEALRNERMQRERAERNRELSLLQRHHLEKSGVTIEREDHVIDESALPYNSVFNPHLSRRPGKWRKTNEEIVSELLN